MPARLGASPRYIINPATVIHIPTTAHKLSTIASIHRECAAPGSAPSRYETPCEIQHRKRRDHEEHAPPASRRQLAAPRERLRLLGASRPPPLRRSAPVSPSQSAPGRTAAASQRDRDLDLELVPQHPAPQPLAMPQAFDDRPAGASARGSPPESSTTPRTRLLKSISRYDAIPSGGTSRTAQTSCATNLPGTKTASVTDARNGSRAKNTRADRASRRGAESNGRSNSGASRKSTI